MRGSVCLCVCLWRCGAGTMAGKVVCAAASDLLLVSLYIFRNNFDHLIFVLFIVVL